MSNPVKKHYKVAVLPGDGIGPEVMSVTLDLLHHIVKEAGVSIEIVEGLIGGAAIDQLGSAFPDETKALCDGADAILFGSVGGPKWEHLPPEEQPERGALLPLRKRYGLYCNLRPARIYPELAESSPLAYRSVKDGIDILVVRELTGGIYFSPKRGRDGSGAEERAFDTMEYNRAEIERIARLGFKYAQGRRKKLTSVDKANVLTTSKLWREVIEKVALDFPDVTVEHMYVDNAAMQLIKAPSSFDVLLTGNLFGDILSDECAMITGSMGLLPSASLGEGGFGLYEPAGGSAPDIAGKGIANPIAQILSLALMLKYSLNLPELGQKLDLAVSDVIKQGYRTADLAQGGASVTTQEMGQLVLQALQS